MGLRPAKIYRKKPKKPYTRVSEKKGEGYISGAPAPKISIFEMGNKKREFSEKVALRVEEGCGIRDNALEAMRIAANSYLKKELTPENYNLRIPIYPHNILRYHPQAGVAQADRFYSGMKKPFGRPTGRSALVDKNQSVLNIKVDENDIQDAKKAAERAGMKIPVSFKVRVE